jgi:hypothetical protein
MAGSGAAAAISSRSKLKRRRGMEVPPELWRRLAIKNSLRKDGHHRTPATS